MYLMLFFGRDELDLLRNYLRFDTVVMDKRHCEVQEVVAMWSHVESAF